MKKKSIGRKTSENNTRKRRNVSISDETYSFLKHFGNGNVSEGIRSIVMGAVIGSEGLEFRVKTVIDKSTIATTVDLFGGNSRIQRLQHVISSITEEHLKQALIASGWTPPAEAESDTDKIH